MKRVASPVAPSDAPQANDRALARAVTRVIGAGGLVVAAWGSDGAHLARGAAVQALLTPHPLHCLALTRGGQPGHPLYLKRELQPVLWTGAVGIDDR